MSRRVGTVLGTMTFSGQTSKEVSLQQLKYFLEFNTKRGELAELDTARMYNKGQTEELLGELLQDESIKGKYLIDSKVNPFKGFNEDLSPEAVHKQTSQILEALKVDCVDVLYLHAPDPKNRIEDTLEAVQALYVEGKFKKLGLSNYSAWEVAHIYHYMSQKNYVKPTIYQGMYNSITRQVCTELLPCLRKFNISFYAYNPMCGGLLSGKYTIDEDVKEGRFKNNQMYKDRYWSESYFHAIDIIKAACKKNGDEKIADACLRWLVHHSELKGEYNDKIILGASTLEHLQANLTSCAGEPLHGDIVKSFDEGYQHILKNNAVPSYSRGFSKP